LERGSAPTQPEDNPMTQTTAKIAKIKRGYWSVEVGGPRYATVAKATDYDAENRWTNGWFAYVRDSKSGQILERIGVFSSRHLAEQSAVARLQSQ
jgi:hypothetical protein